MTRITRIDYIIMTRHESDIIKIYEHWT